jgi:cytochrome c biogenesis protein CcmG/thiol:disulfide interchange protein DsbE
VVAIALSLFAVACGGSDDDRDAAAAAADPIETNDGGVLVKPPDVLDGDTEEDLPPLVEGAALTPVVDFNYFDGTPASTAEFRGRPTVLNFWASNCAACIAEMPEFEEVHVALAESVDFVGMNVADVSRESALRLAEQTGVTYRLGDDTSSAVFREFGGFVMPTTVLLNPQGQVAFSWSGVLNAEELTRLVNEHILSE